MAQRYFPNRFNADEFDIVGAQLQSSANQSISSGTPTILLTSSPTTILDTDGFTTGATSGYLKVPTGLGGWYQVGYSVLWDTISTTGYVSAQITHSDGSFHCVSRHVTTTTSSVHGQAASTLMYLADGDEVAIRVVHTTTGSVNVLSSSEQSAILWLFKVGD